MRPLTFELGGLIAAVALGLIHIVLASHSASIQRGYRWAAGARDEMLPALTGAAGRLARASANYLETFPYFASLDLAVNFCGLHGTLSETGVILYLVGRALYLPLYAFGIFLARSLAWNVAIAGIALLAAALLR